MNPFFDHTFKQLFVIQSNGIENPIPKANMDEVHYLINRLEDITHRRIYVYKSIAHQRREYRCRCNSRCMFRAKFRLRRSDNQVILYDAIFYHSSLLFL